MKETANLYKLDSVINDIKALVSDVEFWIAGGAIASAVTDSHINDYDVFSPNPALLVEKLKSSGATITYENPNFVNFKIKGKKVQVITTYSFNDMNASTQAFDFTVVSAAYDGETFVCHDRFWQDLASKRLVIQSLPFPLKTMERVAKYSRRGYTPCPVGLMKIARAINEMEIDWDNPNENQLAFYSDGTPRFTGVD